MLVDFGNFILRILNSSWNMLNSSSGWMIFSFIVAGVLHEFLKPGEGAENGYWVIEGERRLLDHDIRNVYTDLQLWYDSAWNQHVL